MNVPSHSQRLAQTAYERVASRGRTNKEYVSFAKKFPALIHTCGLAQSVAFALAKGEHHEAYADDLAAVLGAGGHGAITSARALDQKARSLPVIAYLRLSRDAILAADWLKRYAEAAAPVLAAGVG